MSCSTFDTFDMFDEMPVWDLSPDKMCDYAWTRLAWCNQHKVAVYLAAIDVRDNDSSASLGVLVLTPGKCAWAHSVQFSELLYYFSAIVNEAVNTEVWDFTEYSAYAMAKFIDAAKGNRGDFAGDLLDFLGTEDPITYYDEANAYIAIRAYFKAPLPEDLYLRYLRMFTYCDCNVETMTTLTYGELQDKNGNFLKDTPSLACILHDYNTTFLKSVEKAPEKPEKKPKRTTNVRELLWNSYPHVCGLCGEQINSIDEMHVDHIIPLSRGGKDILANLQLTHARCNMDKGNTLFEESEE